MGTFAFEKRSIVVFQSGCVEGKLFIYPIRSLAYFCCVYQYRRTKIFKKPNGTQICFTAKAFNGRVLSQWLCDCLQDASSKPDLHHDPDKQLPLLTSCMPLIDIYSTKFINFDFCFPLWV